MYIEELSNRHILTPPFHLWLEHKVRLYSNSSLSSRYNFKRSVLWYVNNRFRSTGKDARTQCITSANSATLQSMPSNCCKQSFSNYLRTCISSFEIKPINREIWITRKTSFTWPSIINGFWIPSVFGQLY